MVDLPLSDHDSVSPYFAKLLSLWTLCSAIHTCLDPHLSVRPQQHQDKPVGPHHTFSASQSVSQLDFVNIQSRALSLSVCVGLTCLHFIQLKVNAVRIPCSQFRMLIQRDFITLMLFLDGHFILYKIDYGCYVRSFTVSAEEDVRSLP